MQLNGNLDLTGGELQRARQQNYTTLPAYDPSTDVGRVIFVTAGGDKGFWFGDAAGLGTWTKHATGSSLASWALTGAAIIDGATYQAPLTSSGDVPDRGIVTKITVASSLGAGLITLALYNDVARTEKIYECVFDLASAVLTDRIPVGFHLDNSSGVIYIDLTNNTGSAGTFDLDIEGCGITLVPTSSPPGSGSGISAGVAGDGIAYNAVTAQLDVDLAATPGLEMPGISGSGLLRVKVDPAGGIARVAAGIQCDATVLRTSGDQMVAGIKDTMQPCITPTGVVGPPTAGAHLSGEFSLDSNLNLWECVLTGSPGDWVFFGWAEQINGGAVNGTSYTGACAGGATVDLSLTMYSRRGVIRKLHIWACDSAFGAVNIDAPFRVAAFPNEFYEGREQCWMLTSQARGSFLSGAAGGGSATIPLNSVGNVALGDLVRLRTPGGIAGPYLEEYGRVTVRTPGGPSIDIDEVTVNAMVGNALAMYVTEAMNLYWKNNSAIPANYFKLYLRFYNDHPTQALTFGYHLYSENIGGGVPV